MVLYVFKPLHIIINQIYLTPSIIVALSPPPSENQCFHLGPLSVPFSLLKYVSSHNQHYTEMMKSTYNIYLNWNKDSGSGHIVLCIFKDVSIVRISIQYNYIFSFCSLNCYHFPFFQFQEPCPN